MNKKKLVWIIGGLAIVLFYIYSMSIEGEEKFLINDEELSGEMILYTKGANVQKVIKKIKIVYFDSYIEEDDDNNDDDEIPGYDIKKVGENVEVTYIPSKMTIESWGDVLGYDLSEYVEDPKEPGQDIKYSDAILFLKQLELIK